MLLGIAVLVVIAYVPGALLYRMPVADRQRRAALPAEERTFWAVIISITATSLMALALTAVNSYSLGRVVGVDLALGAGIALGFRTRLAYAEAVPKATRAVMLPLALVSLGLMLFFPPAEYVMGGKDPGTYVNEGIQIAQHGSWFIPDAALAAVPSASRSLFVSPDVEGLNQGTTFMGFFVLDADRGRVIGQFPHAYPVWIAIGHGVGGITGALCAVGFWGLIGIVSVYFAAARLLGRLVAFGGALLLTINVAQVWFARYPSSEMMQQALLFAALLALARAVGDGDRFFGPVAGVIFGVMVFARIDTLLLLMAVGAGLLWLVADGQRARWSFWLPLAALLGVAGAYYLGPMNYYASTPLGFLRGPLGLSVITLAFVAAGTAIGVLCRRWPRRAGALRLWVPRAMVIVVVALAAYAYFWRAPRETVHDYARGVTVALGLAANDAYSLRTYGWYVAPWGLLAAVAGLALVFWRRFWRDPVLLTLTVALSAFFFYKTRIVPEHFWLARRYLTVILPMTCVMAAAATLGGVDDWWARRSTGAASARGRTLLTAAWAVAGAVGFLWLGVQYGGATGAILDHVEYAGLTSQMESLASRFTDRDLVLVESRGSSDAHVLATPLAYTYGRRTLLLLSPRPDRAQFEQFCQWATSAYEHVYFLADGGTDITPRGIAITPVGTQSFEVPEYESALNAYPSRVRQKKFSLSIFLLTKTDTPVVKTRLDVGYQDDVWVLRFYAKERENGVNFRWARNMSYVSLMGLPADSRFVRLTMNDGGRPQAAGPARVEVFLNDHRLGEVIVTEGFHDYDIPIPPEVAEEAAARPGASVVRLMCATWKPRTLGRGSDDRDLGVMLSRVSVER